MLKKIVILSGPVASGKSQLASLLCARFESAISLKTNHLIKTLRPNTPDDRKAMQSAGETLDRADGGAWVSRALAIQTAKINDDAIIIVDSVRIRGQIRHVRKAFKELVFHIHLTASEAELAKRYKRRANESAKYTEFRTYEQVRANPTESNVDELRNIADAVIHTDLCDPEDIFVRAVGVLNLRARSIVPNVDVLIGGQYGSEGKGNVAAYLAPEYDILLRVGGPNAGHKVFGNPPSTFRHLPSGTDRNPNALIVLGPGAVINLPLLLQEIDEHQIDHMRLAIDPQSMIITPEDTKGENEKLGHIRSTKQGVGFATARKIMRLPGKDMAKLAQDYDELFPYLRPTSTVLAEAYRSNHKIFLEGTQGTSLSLHHGPYPKVTSRDTTASGCISEAGIPPNRVRRIVMACRTFPIRVSGKESGPIKRELTWKEVHRRSKVPYSKILKTERASVSKKLRRVGEFDWEQLEKAALLNGPTDIALTFVDYLGRENAKARRFDQLEKDTIYFIQEIERVTGVSVSLISTRFHYRNIIDRRAW